MIKTNRFLEKFSEKTKSELQIIAESSKHCEDAIAAAKILLENRKINIVENKLKINIIPFKDHAFKRSSLSLFIRTFSKREIISIISCLTLFFAFKSFLNYYELEQNQILKFSVLIALMSTNNLIYNSEHRRNNNYIGRVIIGSVYLLIFFLVKIIFYGKSIDYILIIYILAIICLLMYESIVSGLILIKPLKLKYYKNLKTSKMITLSIGIIIILFYTYHVYKVNNSEIVKWKELTWDDFHLKNKLFNKYDAGLNLDIYVYYDSIKAQYISYAGSISELAWKRENYKKSPLLLEHEQYHFNITEYYSRKMNDFINKNNIKSKGEYIHRLEKIRNKHKKTQKDYDNETNHSLNEKQQTMWNTRIDSLLNSFDNAKNLDNY